MKSKYLNLLGYIPPLFKSKLVKGNKIVRAGFLVHSQTRKFVQSLTFDPDRNTSLSTIPSPVTRSQGSFPNGKFKYEGETRITTLGITNMSGSLFTLADWRLQSNILSFINHKEMGSYTYYTTVAQINSG